MTVHSKSPVGRTADTSHPPIWPPPPAPMVAATWAAATATMLAAATQHPDIALAAAMVTFGLATISLVAVITSYSSSAQTSSQYVEPSAQPASQAPPAAPAEAAAREQGP
jgi:hypothetical protein